LTLCWRLFLPAASLLTLAAGTLVITGVHVTQSLGFLHRIKRHFHIFAPRYLVLTLENTLHWCRSQGAVATMPVVVKLILGKERFVVVSLQINRCPKLFQHGALHAFDLTIEVWRSRSIWTPFDALFQETLLNLGRGELGFLVGLDALNWKGHLLTNLFEKAQGVHGSACWKCRGDQIAGAVADNRILVQAGCDLAGVELDALTRDGLFIALWLMALPLGVQPPSVVSLQNYMNCTERERSLVQSLKLVLDAAYAKPPLVTQFQEPLLLGRRHFLTRQPSRAFAHIPEASLADHLVAPNPFAEGWARDAAVTTHIPSITCFLEQAHPC
jgi:hypothetical protein